MQRMVITIAAAMLCLAAPSGLAAEEDDSSLPIAGKRPAASQVVRQDTLELPGLTACHQCEWRPKPHVKAAAEQCGTTPDGAARVAEFECGFAPDCERVCNFVRCAE